MIEHRRGSGSAGPLPSAPSGGSDREELGGSLHDHAGLAAYAACFACRGSAGAALGHRRGRRALAHHAAGRVEQREHHGDGGRYRKQEDQQPAPDRQRPVVVARRTAGNEPCRVGGRPALADDAGIGVPATGADPGVRSARSPAEAGRSAGEPSPATAPDGGVASRDAVDAANNALLIRLTRTLPQPVACYYCCVVVLVRHPADPRPLIAEGLWHGTLSAVPSGRHGFGYDPHFRPDGEDRTAAELEPSEKNRISHRARALAALLAALKAGS